MIWIRNAFEEYKHYTTNSLKQKPGEKKKKMSPWIININLTFIQKALKVSILFAEASLTKMDKECKSYMKVC